MRNLRPHALIDQQVLIEALRNPALYPHAGRRIEVVETHISWVVLANHHVYKIKKAVDLGFLDFSELPARKFYCEEEIRLNRRFAPALYEDVVCIGGTLHRPMLGRKPAIEYAVRMHRFDGDKLMDRMLERKEVTTTHIDALADAVAAFHTALPPADTESAYGKPSTIRAPMLQNFEQLQSLMHDGARDLAPLRKESEAEYAACEEVFTERRQQGWVRECHGDLHLGNIVVIGGVPVPFDGIEFNPSFRWIDVMNEVAFLTMDLLYRNRADLAFRFLNRYLETTGDYRGVLVLRFYLAYRAVVRAKVAAIRAHQHGLKAHETTEAMASCHLHLALAELCLTRKRPLLILMHGLPACGKTTVAQAALERLQAFRIRSDVERKRLFGLAPLESSRSRPGDDMYSPEATRRTYDRLYELSRELLAAGFPVIVDAAFLKRAERDQFWALADEMAVPFSILSVQAREDTLRERIQQRMAEMKDASEANLDVLEMLRTVREPLVEQERAHAVEFVNDDGVGEIGASAVWDRLEKKLLSFR